jgi:MFS family permease
MYYAYKTIRKHIDEKRKEKSAATNAEEQPRPGEPSVPQNSGTAPQRPSTEASVQDPEEPPGDALYTGKPLNPKNKRSKKLSWMALLITGFALAIDFTMAMMSIQAFYYSLSGPQSLYGLTFGSYDLTALISAPILGFLADKFHTFKILFAACFLINACGNLIYAFAYLANAWWMMLLARLVAGIGAGALGLGSSYVAETTTIDQRQKRMVTYRISQSLARMIGPFVGYIFLGLPQVNQASSTTIQVFNWYTIPGWVAFFTLLVLVGIFGWMFVDPSLENEHIVKRVEQEGECTPERKRHFIGFCLWWMCLVMLATLLQFGYYSNLFAVFAGQYHAIGDQYDQWKVFIGVGAGAMASSFAYRVGVRELPKIFDERFITVFSSWLFVAVILLIIPYDGSTSVPTEATFYASTALFGVSVVMFGPAVETIFSKKITQYQDVVGENIAKILGTFYMFHAAGRFVGPLVVGAVTYIATPSGQIGYCANGESLDSNGNPICDGDTSTSCAIFSDNYYTQGCVLKHSIPLYSVWAGLSGLLAILYSISVWKYWSYDVVPRRNPVIDSRFKNEESE